MIKVTILGCGGSGGVPLPGGADNRGFWGACDPLNPKNRRRRCSVYVEAQGTRLLIDTAPDLREQLLDNGLCGADAVLYTHDHADHCHGIDDLRGLNFLANAALPAYGSPETMADLERRFSYVFAPLRAEHGHYKPTLTAHSVAPGVPFTVGNAEILSFYQNHGRVRSTGYRIGGFAYSTDTNGFPAESEPYLENLDVWVVDCLQEAPHYSHAHLDLTLSWIARLKPKRAILIHMNQTLDYETLRAKLPENVEPAYDGMVIDCGL
ncbi:MAG: MBL fold metallo-hydrolase [Alphaproteobacteria bacterium]|jgi:phosphoribosyl 1,2-cyclic phosphate phosphodiesterase|nr:MBL fold metallo-hydrolase [Alphaproteobacteria bacterium]